MGCRDVGHHGVGAQSPARKALGSQEGFTLLWGGLGHPYLPGCSFPSAWHGAARRGTARHAGLSRSSASPWLCGLGDPSPAGSGLRQRSSSLRWGHLGDSSLERRAQGRTLDPGCSPQSPRGDKGKNRPGTAADHFAEPI